MEKIDEGQNFTVIVDYAHTADSMEKLYKTFLGYRKICVFGATGGGRDKWKRPEMGRVASEYCDAIILTDDDSYDEDTRAIIADIEKGITSQKKEIIIDRREAIRAGLKSATKDSIVLITGKGTDPYLMGPNNKKTPWDDATVVREELQTYIGVLDFFGEKTNKDADSALLPYTWTDEISRGAIDQESVLALQAALTKSGFYPPGGFSRNDCPLTGAFKDCTTKALKAFQNANDIKADGLIVGPRTRQVLNSLFGENVN